MPSDEQEKVARLMPSFAAVSCAATLTSKLRFAARLVKVRFTRPELMFCSMSVLRGLWRACVEAWIPDTLRFASLAHEVGNDGFHVRLRQSSNVERVLR